MYKIVHTTVVGLVKLDKWQNNGTIRLQDVFNKNTRHTGLKGEHTYVNSRSLLETTNIPYFPFKQVKEICIWNILYLLLGEEAQAPSIFNKTWEPGNKENNSGHLPWAPRSAGWSQIRFLVATPPLCHPSISLCLSGHWHLQVLLLLG